MDYLKVLKQKLGLITTIRDEYLTSIIEGVKEEFKNDGIELGYSNSDMLLVDFAYCKYCEIEPLENMKYRRRCLIIK